MTTEVETGLLGLDQLIEAHRVRGGFLPVAIAHSIAADLLAEAAPGAGARGRSLSPAEVKLELSGRAHAAGAVDCGEVAGLLAGPLLGGDPAGSAFPPGARSLLAVLEDVSEGRSPGDPEVLRWVLAEHLGPPAGHPEVAEVTKAVVAAGAWDGEAPARLPVPEPADEGSDIPTIIPGALASESVPEAAVDRSGQERDAVGRPARSSVGAPLTSEAITEPTIPPPLPPFPAGGSWAGAAGGAPAPMGPEPTLEEPSGLPWLAEEAAPGERPQSGEPPHHYGGADSRPQGGADSRPQGGADSRPQGGADSRPQGGADSRPQGGADSRPQGGADSRPQGARGVSSSREDEDRSAPFGGRRSGPHDGEAEGRPSKAPAEPRPPEGRSKRQGLRERLAETPSTRGERNVSAAAEHILDDIVREGRARSMEERPVVRHTVKRGDNPVSLSRAPAARRSARAATDGNDSILSPGEDRGWIMWLFVLAALAAAMYLLFFQ